MIALNIAAIQDAAAKIILFLIPPFTSIEVLHRSLCIALLQNTAPRAFLTARTACIHSHMVPTWPFLRIIRAYRLLRMRSLRNENRCTALHMLHAPAYALGSYISTIYAHVYTLGSHPSQIYIGHTELCMVIPRVYLQKPRPRLLSPRPRPPLPSIDTKRN